MKEMKTEIERLKETVKIANEKSDEMQASDTSENSNKKNNNNENRNDYEKVMQKVINSTMPKLQIK